jgi:hypothetical protein
MDTRPPFEWDVIAMTDAGEQFTVSYRTLAEAEWGRELLMDPHSEKSKHAPPGSSWSKPKDANIVRAEIRHRDRPN